MSKNKSNQNKIPAQSYRRNTKKSQVEKSNKKIERPDVNLELCNLIIESSDDAIISTDLTGKIVSWNSGAHKVFGYLSSEIIGLPFIQLVPSDRKNEYNGIINKIINNERMDYFETIRSHKTGRRIIVYNTISPVRDKTGSLIGISHTIREISEQKLLLAIAERLGKNIELKWAEEELLKIKNKYRLIFDSTPDSIIVMDQKGKIKECSQKTELLYLREKDKIIGKLCTEFMDVVSQYEFKDVISRLNKLEPVEHELTIIKGDGKVVEINRKSFPLISPNLWICPRSTVS